MNQVVERPPGTAAGAHSEMKLLIESGQVLYADARLLREFDLVETPDAFHTLIAALDPALSVVLGRVFAEASRGPSPGHWYKLDHRLECSAASSSRPDGALNIELRVRPMPAVLSEQHPVSIGSFGIADRTCSIARELRFAQTIMDALPAMFCVFNSSGVVIRWNRCFQEHSGYSVGEFGSLHFDQIFRTNRLSTLFADNVFGPVKLEDALLTRSGYQMPVLLSVEIAAFGSDTYLIVSAYDMRPQKRVERQLGRAAYFDPLTRLPNRVSFLRKLKDRLSDTTVSAPALLLLDIDRFRLINDGLGERVGDGVLRTLATRIRVAIRETDYVARFGADEFAVMLDYSNGQAEIDALVGRIMRIFSTSLPIEGSRLVLSASIGVVTPEYCSTNATDLVRAADSALHQAKDRGFGQVVAYDPVMRDETQRRIELLSDLHAAVANEELRCYLQPIFAAGNLGTAGYEALVRWQHPIHGLLQPMEFLDVAEAGGAIPLIDEWMLAAVLGQLRKWHVGQQRREHWISVNVSPRTLAGSGLDTYLARLRQESPEIIQSLRIELTETALFCDESMTLARLHCLCDLGVKLILDDFGVGFSSLTHLQRFPIAGIKIDRRFVQLVAQLGRDQTMVHALVDLAGRLGLSVTAEGVEEPAQLACLRDMGCELLQGYLLGHPREMTDDHG